MYYKNAQNIHRTIFVDVLIKGTTLHKSFIEGLGIAIPVSESIFNIDYIFLT